MKKSLILISTVTLLTSCGKKTDRVIVTPENGNVPSITQNVTVTQTNEQFLNQVLHDFYTENQVLSDRLEYLIFLLQTGNLEHKELILKLIKLIKIELNSSPIIVNNITVIINNTFNTINNNPDNNDDQDDHDNDNDQTPHDNDNDDDKDDEDRDHDDDKCDNSKKGNCKDRDHDDDKDKEDKKEDKKRNGKKYRN